MIVIPCYLLNGPKGRWYAFLPNSDGTMYVQRWENADCVREDRQSRSTARRLWRWLVRLGYR